MARTVTLNGVTYSVPSPGDTGYDQTGLSNYLVALATAFPQKGGSATLTSTLELAGSAGYGLKANFFSGPGTDLATNGILRMLRAHVIGWRNVANNANLELSINSANKLFFDSLPLTGNPYAEYTSNAGQSIPNAAAVTIVNFEDLSTDTDSAVTVGASWKFTVPASPDSKAGRYLITTAVTPSAAMTTAFLRVYKNGSLVKTLINGRTTLANDTIGGSCVLNLAASDYVDVRIGHSSAGAVTLSATADQNRIEIVRLTG